MDNIVKSWRSLEKNLGIWNGFFFWPSNRPKDNVAQKLCCQFGIVLARYSVLSEFLVKEFPIIITFIAPPKRVGMAM